jgi:hypothetical protein
MARFHATAQGLVPFTPEEEAERDTEEASWVAGETGRLADEARKTRNDLLQKSDWVIAKSQETGLVIPNEWVIYRKALRDVPQQSGFPKNIIWPVPPA